MGLRHTTALALIVAEICYTIVHTATYIVTLQFWNTFHIFYILMYVLEELPNAFNFVICMASFLDNVLPQNLQSNPFALQRALYYWKPIIQCISLLTIIVQIIPVVFGCYIWYFQDGP